MDDHNKRKADGEQVIFKAFTFLLAEPVHEKSVGGVDSRDGDDHVRGNAECGNATDTAEYQTDGAGEFRRNRQKRQRCRNVHLLREIIHRAGKAIAAEPAKRLLCAVREHDDAERQSCKQGREAVAGFE